MTSVFLPFIRLLLSLLSLSSSSLLLWPPPWVLLCWNILVMRTLASPPLPTQSLQSSLAYHTWSHPMTFPYDSSRNTQYSNIRLLEDISTESTITTTASDTTLMDMIDASSIDVLPITHPAYYDQLRHRVFRNDDTVVVMTQCSSNSSSCNNFSNSTSTNDRSRYNNNVHESAVYRVMDYSTIASVLHDDITSSINFANNANATSTTVNDVSSNHVNNVATAYRVIDLKAFLSFSVNGQIRYNGVDDAFTVLLAMYHFNNRHLSPFLTSSSSSNVNSNSSTNNNTITDSSNSSSASTALASRTTDLGDCDIRLTLDLYDDRYSPVYATGAYTYFLSLESSFAISPRVGGIIGADRSAVTKPLAILSSVNEIPQMSGASTAEELDSMDLYPYFGRTVTNTIGEAQAAVRLFQYFDVNHVVVLYVTVRFDTLFFTFSFPFHAVFLSQCHFFVVQLHFRWEKGRLWYSVT
jgi:hypothetical protein